MTSMQHTRYATKLYS